MSKSAKKLLKLQCIAACIFSIFLCKWAHDRVNIIRQTKNLSPMRTVEDKNCINVIQGVMLTVLLAKSDSDFMLCLQSYKGLIIDRSHGGCLTYAAHHHREIINQINIQR